MTDKTPVSTLTTEPAKDVHVAAANASETVVFGVLSEVAGRYFASQEAETKERQEQNARAFEIETKRLDLSKENSKRFFYLCVLVLAVVLVICVGAFMTNNTGLIERVISLLLAIGAGSAVARR